jgi:hypothetical protein
MKTVNLVVIVSCVVLWACLPKEGGTARLFNANDTGRFRREADTSDVYFKDLLEWEEKIGLESLQGGSRDFEMRLWYNGAILYDKAVLIVKHQEGNWMGKVVRFRMDRSGVDTFWFANPKSGWEHFAERLSEHPVKTLPPFPTSGISHFMDDGITYMVEVATEHSYRFGSYTNPQEYAKHNDAAKRWDKMVILLREEFGAIY